MTQYHTFIDSSTDFGLETIQGIQSNGSQHGIGISSDINTVNLNSSGVVIANSGFISVANTTPIQILLTGNTLTFTAVGIGSTSFNLA